MIKQRVFHDIAIGIFEQIDQVLLRMVKKTFSLQEGIISEMKEDSIKMCSSLELDSALFGGGSDAAAAIKTKITG